MNKCLKAKVYFLIIVMIFLTACSRNNTSLGSINSEIKEKAVINADLIEEKDEKQTDKQQSVNTEAEKNKQSESKEKSQFVEIKTSETPQIQKNTPKPGGGVIKKYAPDEEIIYNKYTNAKYGFTIEYPSSYKVKEYSDNRYGAEITNNLASILVFGTNNVENKTPSKLYEEAIKSHAKDEILYQSQKDNWFIVSWKEGSMIKYSKTTVGKGSVNTFIISYPESERLAFQGIIYRISSSFKTPGISEAH